MNWIALEAKTKEAGLTNEEVAKKLSITQAALSQIEAVGSKPRKETLQKLAKIFKIKVEELR